MSAEQPHAGRGAAIPPVVTARGGVERGGVAVAPPVPEERLPGVVVLPLVSGEDKGKGKGKG